MGLWCRYYAATWCHAHNKLLADCRNLCLAAGRCYFDPQCSVPTVCLPADAVVDSATYPNVYMDTVRQMLAWTQVGAVKAVADLGRAPCGLAVASLVCDHLLLCCLWCCCLACRGSLVTCLEVLMALSPSLPVRLLNCSVQDLFPVGQLTPAALGCGQLCARQRLGFCRCFLPGQH
jgi:hypothetical protein